MCFPENCDTIPHNTTVWGMRQRPTEKEFQTWAYKSEITEGKTELSLSYKSLHLPPWSFWLRQPVMMTILTLTFSKPKLFSDISPYLLTPVLCFKSSLLNKILGIVSGISLLLQRSGEDSNLVKICFLRTEMWRCQCSKFTSYQECRTLKHNHKQGGKSFWIREPEGFLRL